MAQLIISLESESGKTHSLSMERYESAIDSIKRVGISLMDEDNEISYLDGEMLILDKDDAKELIAYLQAVFEINKPQ